MPERSPNPQSPSMSLDLEEVKDENGTSIQAYLETFITKADGADLTAIVLVAQKPNRLTLATNIADVDVIPDILHQFSHMIRDNKPRSSRSYPVNDPSKLN